MAEKFESKGVYKPRHFTKGNPMGDQIGLSIPKKALEQFPEIKDTKYNVFISDSKCLIFVSGADLKKDE